MRDKVVRMAIMFPHFFPWKDKFNKYNMHIEFKELLEILKDQGLDSTEKRRIAGWELDRLIYREALKSNSLEEMKELVKNEYEKITESSISISFELIESLAARKDLNDETKLSIYKKFLKGELSKNECLDNSNYISNWLTDLLIFYELSDSNSEIENEVLIEKIQDKLREIIYEDKVKRETVVSKLKRTGLSNSSIGKLYRNNLGKYHKEYGVILEKILLNEIEEKKSEKKHNEKDITAQLMGMLEEYSQRDDEDKEKDCNKSNTESEETINIEQNTEKKEKINDKQHKEKEEKNNIGSNKEDNNSNHETKAIEEPMQYDKLVYQINSIKNNIENVAETLGYRLVKEDEVGEIPFIKKLTNISEGAVLSELYNLYKNLYKTDIQNMEAVLGNFFSTLFAYGLEVEDFVGNIGEVIEVDSKDILTKFIVSKPIDEDGILKGEIKYYGWKYKNKDIMPMVISPTEK